MKVSRTVLCILPIFLLFSCVSGKPEGRSRTSPSLLDMPGKGLYYGFIVNCSSHFIEVVIWSVKERNKVYGNIVLPPSKSHIRKNIKGLKYWDKCKQEFRPPTVFSLWLKLGSYKVSIRMRDDIIDEGRPGTDKVFNVVLDEEYVENSTGPFVFEIEDE